MEALTHAGCRSLFLFSEVDAGDDDDHEKNDSQYAEKYELVASDPSHHGLDQFSAFAELVPNPSQFLPVADQPPGMIAEIPFNIVADFQGLVHHPHPVLQFVGGIGQQFSLSDEFGLGVLSLVQLCAHQHGLVLLESVVLLLLVKGFAAVLEVAFVFPYLGKSEGTFRK